MKSHLQRSRSRLAVVMITGMLILSALVGAGLLAMREFDSIVHGMYHGNTRPITHLANIRAAETNIRRLQWRILAQRDPLLTAQLAAQIREKLALIDTEWARYYPAGISSPHEAALARQLAEDQPRFAAIVTENLRLLEAGDYDGATRRLLSQLPFLDRTDRMVTEDIDTNAAQAASSASASESMIGAMTRMAIAAMVIAVLGAMAVALRLMGQRDDALRKSLEHLVLVDQVFELSMDSVIITNKAGTITKVNPSFCRMTGYAEAEVLGRNPRMWSSGRQSPQFYQEMFRRLEAEGRWQGQMWNRRKNGDLYLESISVTRIGGHGNDDAHYAAICSDITERQMEEAQREYLATHDPLTGLPNRLLFNERLGQAIARARRAGSQVAILFVDLDHFKSINDTLGHDAGDTALCTVAQRLRGTLRDSDTVARLGGDEFAIVLEDLHDRAHIEPIARKLLSAVGEPIQAGSHAVSVTPSIGISIFPAHGADPRQLVTRADQAMYVAKRHGKNAVRFFDAAAAASQADAAGMSVVHNVHS
ncbi:diguanylate cyclase (GGDEF) domain protein [compost metagenome]